MTVEEDGNGKERAIGRLEGRLDGIIDSLAAFRAENSETHREIFQKIDAIRNGQTTKSDAAKVAGLVGGAVCGIGMGIKMLVGWISGHGGG